MTAAPGPVDGVAYTPEQVSEAGWLGKRTAGALRRACAPSRGQLQHTRIGGRILFTAEDIRANLAAGRRNEKTPAGAPAATPPRRSSRRPTSLTAVPQTLRARPERARMKQPA
jgi:hypothetical protein